MQEGFNGAHIPYVWLDEIRLAYLGGSGAKALKHKYLKCYERRIKCVTLEPGDLFVYDATER